MQAMLAAFLQTNTKNTAIQSVQANRIGRTYPLLFMINLPKEEEIIDDLREITTMEYVVQIIEAFLLWCYSRNTWHRFLLDLMLDR